VYDEGDISAKKDERNTKPSTCFYNRVARPTAKTTVTILIVPPKLHCRCALLLTANAFCVVSVVVGGVTFLSIWVGNIFGVVETWNCGASGVPSNSNRCSLYPVNGSRKICHNTYSSVSL
jgi:hypothetical protein